MKTITLLALALMTQASFAATNPSTSQRVIRTVVNSLHRGNLECEISYFGKQQAPTTSRDLVLPLLESDDYNQNMIVTTHNSKDPARPIVIIKSESDSQKFSYKATFEDNEVKEFEWVHISKKYRTMTRTTVLANGTCK